MKLQFYTVPNLNLQDLSFNNYSISFVWRRGETPAQKLPPLAPLLIWAQITDGTNLLDPLPLIGHGKQA